MNSRQDREDKDVPRAVRAAVIERDSSCCRVCGQFVESPALHHIVFRSQGGREGKPLHDPSNLVVVGWLPGHDCHLPRCHGPRALFWRGLLLDLVDHPEEYGSASALQLARWRGVPVLAR